MSEWKPIETAPKDGSYVLLLMDGEMVSVGNWETQPFHKAPRPYWKSERGWLYGKEWDRDHQPTHWMKLPEPPKESA